MTTAALPRPLPALGVRAADWGNAARFALVYVVLNLHPLRNVSLIGYMAVYGLVTAWVGLRYLATPKRDRLTDNGALLWVWLGIAALAFCVSVETISASGAVNGLLRFVFAVPVFLALVVFTDGWADLRRHLATMIAFFVVASWTLPLQFVTGPISWFAASSVRGSETRYSSLVGSLTSIGVIVGCYLALAALLGVWWRVVAAVAITLPAVLSLSKAAIVNVVIGWVLLLFFSRRNKGLMVATLLGGPAVAVVAFLGVPQLRDRLLTVLTSFGIGQSDPQNADVSVVQSLLERVGQLPAENWASLLDFHNPLLVVSGAGYGMGNTALVGPGDAIAPMAHNQVIESLSVFGLFGGGLQWAIIITLGIVLALAWWRTRARLYSVMLAVYLLYVVNSVTANGTLYQPSGADVLFLLMFVALSARVRADLEPHPSVPMSRSRDIARRT